MDKGKGMMLKQIMQIYNSNPAEIENNRTFEHKSDGLINLPGMPGYKDNAHSKLLIVKSFRNTCWNNEATDFN